LGTLLLRDSGLAPRLRPTVKRLCADPTIQVRACAATTLVGLLDVDAEYAIRLMDEMLAINNEHLNGSRSVDRFLYYAIPRNFEATRPILERLLGSSYDPARETGARQSTLAALRSPEAMSLVDQALNGPAAARQGVAQVAAANLGEAAFAEFLEELLRRLFVDDERSVRDAASDCFRQLEPEQVGEHRQLIHDFVKSQAFADDPGDLFYALEKSTQPVPEEAIAACRAFISTAGDLASRAAFDASSATNLILAAYVQAKNQEQQENALDVIDELIANRAYGVDRALHGFDEPF
jgi:hypothetical protein